MYSPLIKPEDDQNVTANWFFLHILEKSLQESAVARKCREMLADN